MCTMESINIFSMQMQMISLEWQYWLFLDWIQCDWACWLVRSNTSRTNYLQISPSLGQIYLQGKIFSNLVYLIKYQSRVGVTGRAQCHVTTAESAAPGMEAIFDRKCPPYSQTTLISSHIQYDVHILVLFGCVSPRMEIWQTHLNIARLLPSQPCSSLWWQGQWIVSRLRLMEHGWRGRSCNQALRWKEALVLGGQAIAADVSQGVSVNAIDENLYQILWIAPHRGCLTCCAWNWENTSNTNTSNTSRATHTHPAPY